MDKSGVFCAQRTTKIQPNKLFLTTIEANFSILNERALIHVSCEVNERISKLVRSRECIKSGPLSVSENESVELLYWNKSSLDFDSEE